MEELREARERCDRLTADNELLRLRSADKDATIVRIQKELSDEKSKRNENIAAKTKLGRIRDQWSGMVDALGQEIKQELEE
jgi:hypothetical protein